MHTYPLPQISSESIPAITTEQMIEVDRLMIEKYHISLIQMMENAGRALAQLTRYAFLRGSVQGKRIMVMAGTGGNGGGAMVAARRLHSWGAEVILWITHPSKLTPVPRLQFKILEKLGVQMIAENESPISGVDLILDGVIGYSLKGDPRGKAKEMILWANEQVCPTLSLDTPSGVSLTEGQIFQPVIKADATLTLALPKRGLYTQDVKQIRGTLYLADISVPPQLYAEPDLGIRVKILFTESDILHIYEEE